MNCRKFKRNLEDYLQDGLDFPGRFGMERHARRCLECGVDVANARRLSELARGLVGVKAPPGFEERVLRRIQQDKSRRRFQAIDRYWVFGFEWASFRNLAIAFTAALFSIAAVLTVSLLREHRGTPAAGHALESGAPTVAPSGVDDGTRFLPRDVTVRPLPSEPPPELAAFGSRALAAGYFDSERGFVPGVAEPIDSDFIEFEVPGPGNQPIIMRLPAKVQIRYSHPSEDYFIRNVSH